MEDFDLEEEHQIGVLCEEGFMEEHYDNLKKDLVRKFTGKGMDKIRKLLKSKKNQKEFMKMLDEETKRLPIQVRQEVIGELRRQLWA